MKSEVKIFISYASEDHNTAERLYNDLKQAGIDPWLDRKNLLAGQNEKKEINKAIKKSSYFLMLLSSNSVSEKGYVQKEKMIAWEVVDELPFGEIFIIPVRLDDSEITDERLQDLRWADLYPSYENGLKQILRSLGLEEEVEESMQKDCDIDFINRVNEKQYITALDCPPYLLIDAPMGYGKTRLIETIKEQLQKQEWHCIHIELPRKSPNPAKMIFHGIFEELGKRYPKDFELSNWEAYGYEIGKNLVEILDKKKLLIIIDNAEHLPDDSVKDFFNQFILSVRELLKDNDDSIQFRTIFSGRYISSWKQMDLSDLSDPLYLSPFDFSAIRDTVENFASKQNRKSLDYKQNFASHLMYFTGGYPGCMAAVLINDFGCAKKEIISKEDEYYYAIVRPVIDEVKEKIPDNLKKIFDTLSVVRRFDVPLLHAFINNELIHWAKDKYDLQRRLLQTCLLNRKDGFVQDDITRRLLSIHLRKTDLKHFLDVCKASIEFYEFRLKDLKSHRPDILAVELLFQKLQYLVYNSLPDCKDIFFKEVLKILSILVKERNRTANLESLKERLEEDWEFRFTFNYMLRKGTYNHEYPYNELIKTVDDFMNNLQGDNNA